MTRYEKQADDIIGIKFKSSSEYYEVVGKDKRGLYIVRMLGIKSKQRDVSKSTILYFFKKYGGW